MRIRWEEYVVRMVAGVDGKGFWFMRLWRERGGVVGGGFGMEW